MNPPSKNAYIEAPIQTREPSFKPENRNREKKLKKGGSFYVPAGGNDVFFDVTAPDGPFQLNRCDWMDSVGPPNVCAGRLRKANVLHFPLVHQLLQLPNLHTSGVVLVGAMAKGERGPLEHTVQKRDKHPEFSSRRCF